MQDSTCQWPGCVEVLVNGVRRGRPRVWCDIHRIAARNLWPMDSKTQTCTESDCDRFVRARGLCSKHYKAARRSQGLRKPDAWTDARRAQWKARYALTRGAPDAERFDYREVFERDGWICGICGDPVDPSLAWPDPMSVSLDHVIPVTKGGKHSRENAQCSHFRCNAQKSDSLAA